MSGGTVTDHRYDLYRLLDWSHVLKNESLREEYSSIKEDLQWLGDFLVSLKDCLNDVDWTLSGDSGNEKAMCAIQSLRETYFDGLGPSDKDLIDVGVYAENILLRLNKIRGKRK